MTKKPTYEELEKRIQDLERDKFSRKKTAETLSYEMKFSKVLGAIANEFITASQAAIDESTDRALRLIGNFVGADRSYVIMFDFQAGTITNTHEWCREGIERQIENLQGLPIETFRWVIDQLSDLQVVHIPQVSDLPDEAINMKEEFEAEGIQSLLLVPLVSEGNCIGTVGFDFVTHTHPYSEIETRLLQTLGSTMSNSLDLKRVEKALRESEERWQFALEGSGDGVWDWNAVTNEVFFSSRWKSMLGFEDHEISGKLAEWDNRVHPRDKDRVYADIDRHFSGETPVYINEHRVLCKDGTYKWILDRGKVISRTAEGKPLRVVGTHTDITDRKKAETELIKAHERLEMLLHSLPLGIVVIDKETDCVIDANPKASMMIGAPIDKLIRRSSHEFFVPNEEEKNPVDDLVNHIDSSEGTLLTFEGNEIPILKTVLSLNLDGKNCIVAIFSDISEIKHAELERMEKEKLQAVIETAGAVCHEMNQPLMALSGYSELLQMEVPETESASQYAKKIHAQVARMGEITKKLMKITSHRTKKYLKTEILDIDGASTETE